MNVEDYYLKFGISPMNTKYDKEAKIFDYFTLIDFAEQYAEAKIKQISEPVIEVKEGIGVRTYKEDELKEELNDLSFLRDAFLVLLNEKVTEKSDLPFGKTDVIKYAKEMYNNSGYSQDFIDECFKNVW